MGLSTLGILHTIIGVLAIAGAVAGFFKYGKINLDKRSGKVYFYASIVTSLSALGISKQGGFNAGHVFSLFILVLLVVAYFLFTRHKVNRGRYLENFLLSFSFFLSLVPTVNETLTRIPLGHPLAKDTKDPLIAHTLLIFFVLFIVGSIYQFVKEKRRIVFNNHL